MISDKELKALRQPGERVVQPWENDEATAPQLGYIKGLIESREVPREVLLQIKERMGPAGDQLTKGKAGEIISVLKQLPVVEGRDDRSINRPQVKDIPVGRYAVQTGEHENDLTFYRVKERENGEGGKYKVIFLVAGPNEHYLGVSSASAKAAAKNIIRAGIGDSAVLYGNKVGRCSQCNIQITNRLSRELGIGPICGGRVYHDWDRRVTEARGSLQARGLDPNERLGD